VRREVYFINCIKNVLTKSILNDGFQMIKNAAREEHKATCKEEILTNLFAMFKKRAELNTLSHWRAGNYGTVVEITNVTV